MAEAISSDRVGFVRMFLESGVDTGDFLSVRMLLRLYNRNLTVRCCRAEPARNVCLSCLV